MTEPTRLAAPSSASLSVEPAPSTSWKGAAPPLQPWEIYYCKPGTVGSGIYQGTVWAASVRSALAKWRKKSIPPSPGTVVSVYPAMQLF